MIGGGLGEDPRPDAPPQPSPALRRPARGIEQGLGIGRPKPRRPRLRGLRRGGEIGFDRRLGGDRRERRQPGATAMSHGRPHVADRPTLCRELPNPALARFPEGPLRRRRGRLDARRHAPRHLAVRRAHYWRGISRPAAELRTPDPRRFRRLFIPTGPPGLGPRRSGRTSSSSTDRSGRAHRPSSFSRPPANRCEASKSPIWTPMRRSVRAPRKPRLHGRARQSQKARARRSPARPR